MNGNWIRSISTIAAVGVVLGAISGLQAGPMIVVGPGGVAANYELLADTPGQWIDLIVSGGDAVAGCNLNTQIGDGGPESGGTLGPIITAVDLEGSLTDPTIFFDNNEGQNDLGSVPQLAMYSIITDSGTVAADGVLARLEIDTTGFVGDRTWTLALGVTRNGPTDFAPTPAVITDGAIHIPEPASLSLLSLGGLAVVMRRRN